MTVDCVDWNLKVNLATHPIGTTEERDEGLNEVKPQVGGKRDKQNFNSRYCRKRRMMQQERKVLKVSMQVTGGALMIMVTPPVELGATPRTPAT